MLHSPLAFRHLAPIALSLSLTECSGSDAPSGTAGEPVAGGFVPGSGGGSPGAGPATTGGAPGVAGNLGVPGGMSGVDSAGGVNGAGGSGAEGTLDAAGGGDPSAVGGAGGAEPIPPLTIWIAGDSTVANGNTPCPVGWGKHFDSEFNDAVTVVNSAAAASSVRTWLYSVTTTPGPDGECILNTDGAGNPIQQPRWVDMQAGLRAGDYLFIQFGIVDVTPTCDRHVGIEAFKDEYGMMARVARDHGAHPIFVTPVSAIACSGSRAVGTRGGFVTAAIDAGAEYDVPVIDLHRLSVEFYNASGFCPIPGGSVSASTIGPVGDFFCDDHTHFSASGALSIGKLVAKEILNLGLPLAAYLE